jgi:hypothetical protein
VEAADRPEPFDRPVVLRRACEFLLVLVWAISDPSFRIHASRYLLAAITHICGDKPVERQLVARKRNTVLPFGVRAGVLRTRGAVSRMSKAKSRRCQKEDEMAQTTEESASAPPQVGETASSKDDAKAEVQQRAEEAKDQAKEKAQEVGKRAQSALRDQLDSRSTQVGYKVTSTADDVGAVGDELRRQGKETPARLADQAAERGERVGRYLQEADADRILMDAEDFGRRQPMAIVAGGLLLGFAAARFLKASSRDRYHGSRSH